MLTGQHLHLCPADYGMPMLPTTELGCGGQPDPIEHARLVIERNRESIRMLAEALLEHESLEADEIKALLITSGATRDLSA